MSIIAQTPAEAAKRDSSSEIPVSDVHINVNAVTGVVKTTQLNVSLLKALANAASIRLVSTPSPAWHFRGSNCSYLAFQP